MTEEEATTKACCGPFREQVPYAGSADRAEIAKNGLDPDYTMEIAARYPCIASACMAWRQLPSGDLTEARAFAANGQKLEAIRSLRLVHRNLSLLEAKNIIEGAEPWPTTGEGGFCGLAGAPQ